MKSLLLITALLSFNPDLSVVDMQYLPVHQEECAAIVYSDNGVFGAAVASRCWQALNIAKRICLDKGGSEDIYTCKHSRYISQGECVIVLRYNTLWGSSRAYDWKDVGLEKARNVIARRVTSRTEEPVDIMLEWCV